MLKDMELKYCKHISNLFNVNCAIFDVRLKKFIDDTEFCSECCRNKCNFINTHLYGCYEAERWSDKYIYYCAEGLVFIAIALRNEMEIMDYAVITGPFTMGPVDDMRKDAPHFSTAHVNDLCEILEPVFTQSSQFSAKQTNMQKEDFLKSVYKVVDDIMPQNRANYPIELERELQDAIQGGNLRKSKELLNKLLGHIFFHSNNNLEIIKVRVLELIVLLSRSTIEGGARVDDILKLTGNYIKEVENFKTLDSLSVWLIGVIDRFIGYVFEFIDVKHTDTIWKVTAYIKENYRNKISLEDIAEHVFLSKSYLSKIFKEEMDLSITSYINKVRIEKSRSLLLDSSLTLVDIANLIGFEDQSYFTKVFKNLVGVSPGKYREKHGMPGK